MLILITTALLLFAGCVMAGLALLLISDTITIRKEIERHDELRRRRSF